MLLQDHAEPRPQRLQVEAVDVLAVDCDVPAVGLQHAQQTHNGCGLSASSAPHDSDLFSGTDVEGDLLEHIFQLRPIAH